MNEELGIMNVLSNWYKKELSSTNRYLYYYSKNTTKLKSVLQVVLQRSH